MKINIVQIIIWNSKAFLPSNGIYQNGLFTNVKPVFIVKPSLDELVPIVNSILAKEPVLLPDPSLEEVKEQNQLLLKITGAKNWKQLCQKGINYVIELSDKGIMLTMSRLDPNGRWEYDPNKQKRYQKDTLLSVIVQDILYDLASR